ncbi:hypothetical protein [Cognaticolwellia mytili]|uniref:hypothetical protein n=1 Tax=Cognaticolwellia mytili TaxID=1888913 RepID=UPI000A17389F|nr:hypothetical protein [Cognaticolwellia mytili]
MQYTQQDLAFNTITTPLGDELTWRWEEQMSALLAEFSWEKKDRILATLRELFSEEWNKKNIKKAPKTLKEELGELASLNKEQLIFTRPASDKTPTLAVIWWPWGHGATYSMRIKVLDTTYSAAELQQAQASLMTKLIKRIMVNLN